MADKIEFVHVRLPETEGLPFQGQDADFRHFADYFCVFCGTRTLWSCVEEWEPSDGVGALGFVECIKCGRDFEIVNAADEPPEEDPTSIVAQIRAAVGA